jgi:integrase
VGSAHRHGNGWRWHWRDADGAVRRSPTQPTREAAEVWAKRHAPAQGVETVGQLADLWRSKKPTPYRTEAAAHVARVTADRGITHLRSLSLAALEEWGDAGHSRYQQYLATILRWGARTQHLPIPADVLRWRPPSRTRRPKRPLLTDALIADIRECAAAYGERAYAVVDYLLSYGARPVTACQATIADLDVPRLTLTIQRAKHSGGWRHPITPKHADRWSRLTRWTPDGDAGALPLFPHYREDRTWKIARGKAAEIADWYRNTIAKRLTLPRECSGIYDLKRACITGMLRRGLAPQTIAQFTGHLDVEQVLTYAVTGEELARSALDKLALDVDASVPKPVPKFPAQAT